LPRTILIMHAQQIHVYLHRQIVLVAVYPHHPTKQPVTHKVLVLVLVEEAQNVPLLPMDRKPLVLLQWMTLLAVLLHVPGLLLIYVLIQYVVLGFLVNS